MEPPHDYCWASDWTRVIAWFQIVCTVLGIIGCTLDVIRSIRVVAVAFRKTKHYEHPDGSVFTAEEIRRMRLGGIVILVLAIISLLVMVLALVMAIFLLQGSINKDPSQIQAWITYTFICMGFWTMRTIGHRCCNAPSARVFGCVLLSLACGLAFQGFCLWVVITHKNQIDACP